MKYWLFAVFVLFFVLRIGAVLISKSNFKTDWKWLAKKGGKKDKTE